MWPKELLPSSQITLVIILGASEFTPTLRFERSPALKNSAEQVRMYFRSIFCIPEEHILYLFDDKSSIGDQEERIAEFLQESKKSGIRDVIVYFIGHGAFYETDNRYYLVVRRSQGSALPSSNLNTSHFAQTIKEHARHLRRIIILDSCFSGAAQNDFASAQSGVAIRQMTKEFEERDQGLNDHPTVGTVLLCAASKDDVAITPNGANLTAFSEAWLSVLQIGDVSLPNDHLSCHTLHRLMLAYLDTYYHQGQVPRPELHAPDQSRGNVAEVPLFPNVSKHTNILIKKIIDCLAQVQIYEIQRIHCDQRTKTIQLHFCASDDSWELAQALLKRITAISGWKIEVGPADSNLTQERSDTPPEHRIDENEQPINPKLSGKGQIPIELDQLTQRELLQYLLEIAKQLLSHGEMIQNPHLQAKQKTLHITYPYPVSQEDIDKFRELSKGWTLGPTLVQPSQEKPPQFVRKRPDALRPSRQEQLEYLLGELNKFPLEKEAIQNPHLQVSQTTLHISYPYPVAQKICDQFKNKTGWTLGVEPSTPMAKFSRPFSPPSLTSDQARQFAERFLSSLKGYMEVSLGAAPYTLQVRFRFPAFIRNQHKSDLDHVRNLTGWSIDLFPRADETALYGEAIRILPASTEIHGHSYSQNKECLALVCSPLTKEQIAKSSRDFLAATGWQLDVTCG